MSGCFGSSPHDRWMEGQLNAYLDSQECPPSEFEFNCKLRGGTVAVACTTEEEVEEDEDGKYRYLIVNLEKVNWTFDPEWDVDLTNEEEEYLKTLAREEMEEYA